MKTDVFRARASNWAAAVSLAFAMSLGAVADARAEALADVLPDLLKTSKKMKAAEADVGAAREKAREALGDWFPKLDLTGSYGYERQFKGNNTADTSIPPREFDMKITQLLWDFGSANRSIDNARLTFTQSQAARASVEQTVLLEGIVAYIDLMRRTRILDFSRGSEDNVKRQSELEDARVQRGSGFSTDVLQSKRQLASAQAARVRAEGALQVARNRYLNVYDKLPDKPATLAMPRLPIDLLPASLNDVVDIAGKENPQLKAAKMTTDIARNNVSKTLSDKFAPTVNLVGEHGHKNDFDGTIGTKNERMVKVEGKYSFNLGFTAINTLKASSFTLTSTENKYGETFDNVLEQARNAWQEFETSKQNLEHLRNEANIAAEFLELARKERALGRRSLIDVLSGETALINASSDAASAEADMAISVFKLLSAMGRLDLGAVAPTPSPSRGEAKESTTASVAPDAPPVRQKAAEIVAEARARAAEKSAAALAATAAVPPSGEKQTEPPTVRATAPDDLKWESPPANTPAAAEAPPAPAVAAPAVSVRAKNLPAPAGAVAAATVAPQKPEIPVIVAPVVSEEPPVPEKVASIVSEVPPPPVKIASADSEPSPIPAKAAPASRAKTPSVSSPLPAPLEKAPILRASPTAPKVQEQLAKVETSPGVPARAEIPLATAKDTFADAGNRNREPGMPAPRARKPAPLASAPDASDAQRNAQFAPDIAALASSAAPDAPKAAPPSVEGNVSSSAEPVARARKASVSSPVPLSPEMAPAVPLAATNAKVPAVLYAVQNVDLRVDTSVVSAAVHMLNRCDPVHYVDGRLGWLRVRAPSSASGGVVEGWVFGHFVSENKSECELKWSAR